MAYASASAARDPAEAVALVAASRRALLLRVHRRRLRFEDLEDCYSQATLELVARARRAPFQSTAHIANALEQKFLSRIDDRRRAISGRSAMEAALAGALPIDEPDGMAGELEDRGAEVLRHVAGRLEIRRLREVAADLTEDQRLVIACQVGLEMECSEFCERFGWSPEKFRKVAQRARARLRVLVERYQSGERCRALEAEMLALAAGIADPRQAERVRAHLANCTACARQARELERVSREVAALLPLPLIARSAPLGKLAGLLGLRRLAPLGAHVPLSGPTPEVVAAGAGGLGAGGPLLGAGLAKLGIAAACVASAASGLAICTHTGLIGGHPSQPWHARRAGTVTRTARADAELKRAFALVSPAVARRESGSQPSPRPRRRQRHPSTPSAQARVEFGPRARRLSRRSASAAEFARASLSPPPPVRRRRAVRTSSQPGSEFGFER